MFSTLFGIAVINGVTTTLNEAKIPLIDRGFLFGHAIFETLLYHKNDIVDWDSHYARLQNGCAQLKIASPTYDALKRLCHLAINEMKKLISSSALESEFLQIQERLSIKILVTGGDYPDLMPSFSATSQLHPNIYLICRPAPIITIQSRLNGYKLKTVLDERGSLSTRVKNTNYLFSFLCLDNAQENGFDDILFINASGDYTEGATSSLIWFDKTYHVYSTPPIGNCLAGTSVLQLKNKLIQSGYLFDYRSLQQNQISQCVGCALVSSVRGVMPIKSIDKTTFEIKTHESFFKILIELLDS